MSTGVVRIVMQVTGTAAVRAAMRGVVTEGQRADAQLRRSAQQVERDRQRDIRRTAQQAERAARERAQAEGRAARETARSEQRALRERVRAEARAAAETAREQQRHHRVRERALREEERRVRRDAGGGGGMLGEAHGALAGVAGAAVVMQGVSAALDAITARLRSVTDAVGQRAGVREVGERTAEGQDFSVALARSSAEFFQGTTTQERHRERDELRGEILATSRDTGIAPSDILAGLDRAQTQYDQFDAVRRDMTTIAREAERMGVSFEEAASFVGLMNQQLGDTAPNAQTLFDITAAQGLSGSLTPSQFSENFGPLMGLFRAGTGATGEDAFRQMGGTAQALAGLGESPSEAATHMRGLLVDLGNDQTRARLIAATGGRVRRSRGRDGLMHTTASGGAAERLFRDDGTIDWMQMQSVLGELGDRDLARVFHNSESLMGAQQIASLQRRQRAGEDVMTAADFTNVDANAGAQFRAGALADVHSDSDSVSRRIANLGTIEGIEQTDARAAMANKSLAFDEAVRQLGAEGVIAGVQSIPLLGGLLSDQVLPHAASALGQQTTPEMRSMMAQLGGGLTSLGLGGFGNLAGTAVQGVGNLAELGARTNTIRDAAARKVTLDAPIIIDPASSQRLAADIARATAQELRGAAPTAGRTPGEPRR